MKYLAPFHFALIVFVGVLFFIPHAYAQEGSGISLLPAVIEEAADPGATLTENLKVTNDSASEKEYFIYKRNIKGVEGGGVPVFAENETEKTGYEISDWIDIQTEPLHVQPGESITVPITIHVPDSATPGSHFGGVFLSVEPPKLRETGAGVGYEVASIISIRISGDIVDTARIRSFSTDKLVYGSKNVHFAAKVENQGNILIRPRGPVEITGMFGGKSEVFMVNDTQAGVFPGSMRDFEFDMKSDTIGFGRYEAVLALSYDGENGQKTIDASLVFWVFPVKIILSILTGFAAIFIVGYALTKYYVNQAIMRAAGGRRITPQRYRKQVGVSRFTFIFTALMVALLLFLIIILIFVA